jgi:hypothetical protein
MKKGAIQMAAPFGLFGPWLKSTLHVGSSLTRSVSLACCEE